jgi:LysR family transcriptional regulator, benzoate and cis,cis-muconate-responsive activator of ben and cat genes
MIAMYSYFVAVVDSGGASAAAAELHVSQPTITRGLKALEKHLGTSLFRRGNNRLTLTRVGQQVLPRARAILAEHRRVLQEVSPRNDDAAAILLGAAPAAMLELVPRIATSMVNVQPVLGPGASVEVASEPSGSLAMVRDGKLDILFGFAHSTPDDDALCRTPLLQPTFRAIAPSAHWSTKRRVSLADLRHECWVLPAPGTACRAHVDAVFARHGFTPKASVMAVRDHRLALRMVAEGGCVSLVHYHPALFPMQMPGIAWLDLDLDLGDGALKPPHMVAVTRSSAAGNARLSALISLASTIVSEFQESAAVP